MAEQKEKLEQVIGEIDEVVDLFYQQKTSVALNSLEGLIANITQAIDSLFLYRQENENFNFDEERITSMLTDAMTALQEKDMVLMADILQYDFREYLGEIAEKIE